MEITLASIKFDGRRGLGGLVLDVVYGGSIHFGGCRSGSVARRGKGGKDVGKDGELHDFNVYFKASVFQIVSFWMCSLLGGGGRIIISSR
jgi:hypothetical protein